MLDILGLSVKDLARKFGKPTRIEASEYGFSWYVYNKDYKSFHMAGVSGNTVVAAYTNGKSLFYNNIKLNTTKEAVREIMGTPVSFVKKDALVYIISDMDQKDTFDEGDHYVIVFYDIVKKSGVTSILIIPKALEANAVISHPALSDAVVAAYQRISIDLVNASRVRANLKILKTDGKNTKLAIARSKDMLDKNYFSHYTKENLSPFDQAKRMGIKYKSMGENIAFGNHNAIFAHETFMNSAGHRGNIEKAAYTKIGSGVAYGGPRYVILAVEFTG